MEPRAKSASSLDQKPLGQILKEMELINEGQVQEALALQRQEGGAMGETLIKLGYISHDDLLFALAAQRGMEAVSLEDMEIPKEIITKIPFQFALAYQVIPCRLENNTLVVAMAKPQNITVLDDLKTMLNCPIQAALATEEDITKAIGKYYRQESQGLSEFVSSLKEEDIQVEEPKSDRVNVHSIEDINAPPVKKLLNVILGQTIRDRAADLHFEPFESEFKVRERIDGVLYEMQSPPLHLATPLVARLKVMANLDISETRMPQDGRISLDVKGKAVDLRVATLPTIYGESVVVRVLDRSVSKLDIGNLGLSETELKLVKNLINLPHGIILATGPTGSGKTTTLYSALNAVNDIGVKIITTEDPVEYDIDGIVQCTVNEEIGVTYPSLLRTILRQDPDVILVGEIRDLATAEIAIEAALTGHLVFSTLHTNDAPSSIIRLVELGIDHFLVTATLEAVIAQRLVRKICVECREEIEPTEDMLIDLNLTADQVKGKKFCHGRGCPQCNNTGYKGRTAIYEVMLVNEKIKELILNHASTDAIRAAAQEQGMRTLRESGLAAMYSGITSVEEVVRETLLTL